MTIPFTQFLMPDGRRRDESIDRPLPIAQAAQEIIKRGYEFEIEVLTTGQVSMEIVKGDDILGWEICENGPSVPLAVDKMVTEAFAKL